MMNHDAVPFAYMGDSNQMSLQIPRRLKITKDFIGRDISNLHTLDIGCSNEFGRQLGLKDNTADEDLNFRFDAPSMNYDLIGCFEIIEHTLNPLFVLTECYKHLKPGGVLYVSTPRPWFGFLQGKQHPTEYKVDRFIRILEFAGFKVTKTRKFQFWSWRFVFYGFRPLFRVLFHRTVLYECVK